MSFFITFEGPEGSGKTTIINKVAKYFDDNNIDYITTREPGGIKIAEQIRNVILDINNKDMDPKTEALLYAASRIEHLNKKVIPALNEGKIVLCDRYLDSSLVYQGVARGLGIDDVLIINSFAKNNMPDLTIFFDVTPEVGLNRIKDNNREVNRIDLEKLDFHKKVYCGYKSLLDKFPNRIKRVDGLQSIQDVYEDTIKLIIELIKG